MALLSVLKNQPTRCRQTFRKPEAPNYRPIKRSVLVFDACQVGVVLRTVLFVQAVLAVSVMFFEASFMTWMARLALITGGALPGTLVWLIVACSLKHQLQRLPRVSQYTAGIAIGMLAGLYASAMLLLASAIDTAPWLASVCAGGLFRRPGGRAGMARQRPDTRRDNRQTWPVAVAHPPAFFVQHPQQRDCPGPPGARTDGGVAGSLSDLFRAHAGRTR